MSVGTTAAIAIGAGVSAAGAIGGAALSSHAAGKAADTQANAADYAANLQKEEADNALAFQKQEWQTQQNNMAPWLKTGQGALGNLAGLMGIGPNKGGDYGSLLQGFQAPTGVTEQNDPGYQERLKIGQQMLENSAAAHGGLLSGNTAAAEQKMGQDYASNEYGNVYNRAFNTFETNQTNKYNRLAGLSGIGQQTAAQLGQQGQSAANNMGNIFLTSGAQQGADIQNAAYQRASGYLGGANAWAGALSGGTNNLMQLLMMNQGRQNDGNSGAGGYDPYANWG